MPEPSISQLSFVHHHTAFLSALELGKVLQRIGSIKHRLGRLLPMTCDTDWWWENSCLTSNETLFVPSQGVQHLKTLERLILYYNCIPSIEEVKVLCELPALRELDLRLNPLTKSYPHYRQYLVHAMPNLLKLGKIQPLYPHYSYLWCSSLTEFPPLHFRRLLS